MLPGICVRRFCESVSASKRPFPRMYFDLKAFRKGISEKKHSLIEAEKKQIARAYAKAPPAEWGVMEFLKATNISDLSTDGGIKSEDERNNFYSELSTLFEDWSDLVSCSKKDLFRVSHFLNSKQLNKLAHCIDLFNHDLFPYIKTTPSQFSNPIEPKPWTSECDATLVRLATEKYDYTFGDVWIYIASEMERDPDDVEQRFHELHTKPFNKARATEITLTKSYRPLLMNRQFRLMPPQCYIIPSEENFPDVADSKFKVPEAFRKYQRL